MNMVRRNRGAKWSRAQLREIVKQGMYARPFNHPNAPFSRIHPHDIQSVMEAYQKGAIVLRAQRGGKDRKLTTSRDQSRALNRWIDTKTKLRWEEVDRFHDMAKPRSRYWPRSGFYGLKQMRKAITEIVFQFQLRENLAKTRMGVATVRITAENARSFSRKRVVAAQKKVLETNQKKADHFADRAKKYQLAIFEVDQWLSEANHSMESRNRMGFNAQRADKLKDKQPGLSEEYRRMALNEGINEMTANLHMLTHEYRLIKLYDLFLHSRHAQGVVRLMKDTRGALQRMKRKRDSFG